MKKLFLILVCLCVFFEVKSFEEDGEVLDDKICFKVITDGKKIEEISMGSGGKIIFYEYKGRLISSYILVGSISCYNMKKQEYKK